MTPGTFRDGPPSFPEGPDDDLGFDAPSERQHRSYVHDLKANDRAERQHFEGQMRAQGLDPATGERQAPRGQQGAHESPGPSPVGRLGASVASGARSGGGTVAGLALGAFAYFLGLAFIRGGPAGARAWLAAKFINRPPGSTSSAPVNPAAGSSSSATAPAASSTAPGPSSPIAAPNVPGISVGAK